MIAADPKSAELIRPILRGRDIKRYHYTFADLWLIATFPSRHYDINNYPAIKEHLLSFGIERLEQTGLKHSINGKDVKSRKKTNNKWFETQDSISYWNDFLKQKIVYPETTQGAYFYLDNNGFFVDKTCFMMLSDTPEYLVATLSSRLFEYAYKRIFSSIELGQSAYQYNKHALLKLPVIRPEKVPQKEYEEIVLNVRALQETDSGKIASEHVEAIDEIINCIYNLTAEEIDYINS